MALAPNFLPISSKDTQPLNCTSKPRRSSEYAKSWSVGSRDNSSLLVLVGLVASKPSLETGMTYGTMPQWQVHFSYVC